MTEQQLRSREWLLLNAVEAWLYHYQSDSPTSEQYKQLRDEFHDVYMQSIRMDVVEHKDAPEDVQPEPKQPRKRTTNGSHSQPS